MKGAPLLEALDDEAHVWLTDPVTPEETPACLEVLAPEEHRQCERFRVEHARRLYLAARSLARRALSRYVDVDPAAWRFRFNRHGRPEIDSPDDLPPLRFNLSHTRGLVACLVTLGSDAGVDVEQRSRQLDLLGVARHSFSAAEAADVRRCDAAERGDRFFTYWTLKESYIKARGMGMALPLKRFSFSLPSPGRLELWLDPELDDDAGRWQFGLFRATADHLMAVAVARGSGPDLRIVCRRATPSLERIERIEPDVVARTRSQSAAAAGAAEV